MVEPLVTFDEWWQRLQALADVEDWELVGEKDDYQEYYDDGDSPEEALAIEQSYAEEDDKTI